MSCSPICLSVQEQDDEETQCNLFSLPEKFKTCLPSWVTAIPFYFFPSLFHLKTKTLTICSISHKSIRCITHRAESGLLMPSILFPHAFQFAIIALFSSLFCLFCNIFTTVLWKTWLLDYDIQFILPTARVFFSSSFSNKLNIFFFFFWILGTPHLYSAKESQECSLNLLFHS